jgi:hypothetical protein
MPLAGRVTPKAAKWSENGRKFRYQRRKCRILVLPLRVAVLFFDAFPEVYPTVCDLLHGLHGVSEIGHANCDVLNMQKRAFRHHGRNALC